MVLIIDRTTRSTAPPPIYIDDYRYTSSMRRDEVYKPRYTTPSPSSPSKRVRFVNSAPQAPPPAEIVYTSSRSSSTRSYRAPPPPPPPAPLPRPRARLPPPPREARLLETITYETTRRAPPPPAPSPSRHSGKKVYVVKRSSSRYCESEDGSDDDSVRSFDDDAVSVRFERPREPRPRRKVFWGRRGW